MRRSDRRGRGVKPPREREDRDWDAIPPPGHSRCGGSKVAGYDVTQEQWDEIFGGQDGSLGASAG